jgi:hypothetical protein
LHESLAEAAAHSADREHATRASLGTLQQQQQAAAASSSSKQQQQAAAASSSSKQQQQAAAAASSSSKQQQQAAAARSAAPDKKQGRIRRCSVACRLVQLLVVAQLHTNHRPTSSSISSKARLVHNDGQWVTTMFRMLMPHPSTVMLTPHLFHPSLGCRADGVNAMA